MSSSTAGLEFSACNGGLGNPRALPSGHSFCMHPYACLNDTLEGTWDETVCAICREEYPDLNALALNSPLPNRIFFLRSGISVKAFPVCREVHPKDECVFVGVFEEKARLLQWLVFFVSSTRSVQFLCIMHFYHMYLVLHFERIQSR